MKLFDLRKQLKSEFASLNIEEEDVDFIISETLSVKRTELTLINEIDKMQYEEIMQNINQRKNNIPVDKIFKRAYFYGLEFKVDENVLSPRPESELIVEKAVDYIKVNNYKTCLDLCTGSGCLAISTKLNSEVEMTATDVSMKALNIAKQNAKNLQADIKFIRSNMFEKIEGTFDLIISNPPYIDSDEVKTLDAEVLNNDPHIALDGGEMGLKFYNIIHDNLRKYLNDGGMIIMEIGEDQKDLPLLLLFIF